METATLAVVDISRAYRHFPTCPLAWPLLVLQHGQKYYFDRATPFGARMSSYIMQSAANFVIRALAARGIEALMYLDDLIIISDALDADSHFKEAIDLLGRLGLEVAPHKLQPPARAVVWLGIRADLDCNTISIPPAKLLEIQQGLAHASRQQSLTRRNLQRAIGLINHLSKVVAPARLFMGRLLGALRGAPKQKIRVTRPMKADFSWFRRFLNRKAIIPQEHIKRHIWADACLQGAGATDGNRCYTYSLPEAMRAAHHITQLEAINCLAAASLLTQPEDAGNVVVVNCDNQPAVDAFSGGRAEDPVLSACARAMWFLSAQNQVTYEFRHIPGDLMCVPDALSRVMISDNRPAGPHPSGSPPHGLLILLILFLHPYFNTLAERATSRQHQAQQPGTRANREGVIKAYVLFSLRAAFPYDSLAPRHVCWYFAPC